MSDDNKQTPVAGGGDYAVGYGKPPEATRFRKGKSGNPKGRPPKKRAVSPEDDLRSVNERVRAVLEKPLRARTEAGMVEMTPAEAMVHRTVQLALSGDPRALREGLRILRDLGLLKPAPEKVPDSGVLVVYSTPSLEEWMRETEGDNQLTKDPLEGIPGVEGMLREAGMRKEAWEEGGDV